MALVVEEGLNQDVACASSDLQERLHSGHMLKNGVSEPVGVREEGRREHLRQDDIVSAFELKCVLFTIRVAAYPAVQNVLQLWLGKGLLLHLPTIN